MSKLTRRQFVAAAAAMGATVAWADAEPARPRRPWVERRDLFAEGVASGDPGVDSVLLWTRASSAGSAAEVPLTVEVAEDELFARVVATARTRALAAADHTCRVLVGGLKPARTYWYRFSDERGQGSRVGRTRTAAAVDDPRPVRFSFVSCQNVCEGAQNAYRRMIFEDERVAPEEQLAFVLHLGDFVYEVVDYPEELPGGRRYDRKVRDVVRFRMATRCSIASMFPRRLPTTAHSIARTSRIPTSRTRVRAGRSSPCGTTTSSPGSAGSRSSSSEVSNASRRPARSRPTRRGSSISRRAYARAARVRSSDSMRRRSRMHPSSASTIRVSAPSPTISLRSAASPRTGACDGAGISISSSPTSTAIARRILGCDRSSVRFFLSEDFPELVPQEALEILDAGRVYAGGRAPDSIRFGEKEIANFRKGEAPQTILGAEQKKWFLERLRGSDATWKVWGNSQGTLDTRADPQNLPAGSAKPWPGAGYASLGFGDYSSAYHERREIYDALSQAGITGFVTVSGDRHSFWAGLAASALPPQAFEPIGAAFITGSVSAPGVIEALEHRFPKDHPLRALYLTDLPGQSRPQPAFNLLLHHGVRSCLEYQRSGDLERARALSNRELSPHLSFVDMAGHGYAALRVSGDEAECEFVCIPRPVERSADPTEGRSATGCLIAWRSGAKASARVSNSACLRAIPACRPEAAAFPPHGSRPAGTVNRFRGQSRILDADHSYCPAGSGYILRRTTSLDQEAAHGDMRLST